MSSEVRIGWAGRDITPKTPVLLRGQFNLRVATRVNDSLTLTALAIDGDGDRAVFVSVDACGVDEEVIASARGRISHRLPDFGSAKLIVCATHTHTAPFAGGNVGLQKESDYIDALRERYPGYTTVAEYTDQLVAAIAGAACDAWEARRPGRVAWGYSYAAIGENRRVRYFDGRALMYGSTSAADFSHIEGHVDHGVNLLFTYAPDGGVTGIVVNLACPSQASAGGQDYISADYWHETRDALRARYGNDLFVLPQCSAAGDQTPHRLLARDAEDRMLRLKFGEGLSKAHNIGLRRDIARRILDAVADAEPYVRRDMREGVALEHECRTLDVPHWDVTAGEHAALETEMAGLRQQLEELADADRLGSRYTALRSRMAWCQRAIDRYHSPPASIPVEMHVIRLGDIAFVTVPFEYYLDFGDRIKGRSPALQTFVVQLAGGGTYLPTARAAGGCSYGAVPPSCRVAPRGGQVLVDEAVDALGRMFAE